MIVLGNCATGRWPFSQMLLLVAQKILLAHVESFIVGETPAIHRLLAFLVARNLQINSETTHPYAILVNITDSVLYGRC